MSQTWSEYFSLINVADILHPDDELGKQLWNPSDEDKSVAWKLFNELNTRISCAPIRYRDGDESAALGSLHKLFELTRKILAEHGPNTQHATTISHLLLNDHIREFTSRWHRRSLQGQLEQQDDRRVFRKELESLQKSISSFVVLFGKLAGAKSVELQFNHNRKQRVEFDRHRVWPEKLIGPSAVPEDTVSLKHVITSELEYIAKRRNHVFQDEKEKMYGGLGQAKDVESSVGLIGLAISGGGIRSASFALGAVQKLAERGILKDVDYLATVSGGGYFGAFLSSHLTPFGSKGGEECAADARQLLVPDRTSVETPEVRWLRNRSKSLIGRGLLNSLSELFCRSLVFLWPLMIAAVIVSVSRVLWPTIWQWIFWGNFLWVSLYLWFGVDVNRLSLRPMYRRRLAQTYIAKYSDQSSNCKLSNLAKSELAPYHLVCAAVNLPKSTNVELRGRRSDFFIFSPEYCGSILTGYCKTVDMETADSKLDLATAVAVSGAAVASQMGTMRSSLLLRPFLLLFRLSYWMPNPAHVVKKQPFRFPLFNQLLREVFARYDETRRWINISDGGHIENLGIYELLRRRCKLIVCIDGEHDPELSCSSLIKACRFASIDMGIDIEIDVSELKKTHGYSQSHFGIGTINYNTRPGGHAEVGYLVYIKLSMTGNERSYIHEYRQRYPDFPHQPTSDQLFDEDQFEAYRALGSHAAEDLFAEELVGQLSSGQFKTREWIEALVDAIEPPAPREGKI